MASAPERLFFEDLQVGESFMSGSYEMTQERILSFASEFDPQPFHTDPDAAQETFFAGLAASGWHTSAVTMRLLVESVPVAGGLIGAGSEISWPRAVRPGDLLRVTTTIRELAASKSKPDRGFAVLESITLNQDDAVCQTTVSRVLVFRRADV
ncbi:MULTISPECIES: MaoC family dehydratase [Pseudomonas]|uniref:MaoC family dehydratase n=1 Tax=Pseudomonas TaxID=286 RepID=UPI000778E292|nr:MULTISPECIES: MaoC family dehydratase [Pseudomonas]KYC21671.1 dehydratase [Pseudomonas sp. ABFPK]MBA6111711.1 MaoC family dehydratase [Pseudomonas asiatica]UPK86115.1 MaoC family dehydratase [Pseudomonas sp. A2]GLO31640.1 MaoC family dehydratase [Pseudomonas putida]